jgi:hypothetical protein
MSFAAQHGRILGAAAMTAVFLGGCAATSGIVPYAPGTFLVSEMRAPVLGGAAEAQRAALAEATGFCAQQGLVFVPVTMGPGGYPYSAYGPTTFTATFQCRLPNDPVTIRSRQSMSPPPAAAPAKPN